MNTNQLIITLTTVLLITYAVYRQVAERQVKKINFIIFPIIAAYECYNLLPRPMIPVNQIFECIFIIIVGLAAGAIQATYTRVYYKGEQLYMRGGKETLIAWIAMISLRIIIRIIFNDSSSYTSFQSSGWILFAGMTSALGFRSTLLYLKYPEVKQFFEYNKSKRHIRRNG